MSSSSSPAPGLLSRRRLIHTAAFAGVVPLTACQGSPLLTTADDDAETDGPDPDEALLAAAVRDEAEMAARLRGLLRRSPGRVRRSLQVHEAHLELLGGSAEQRQDAGEAGGPLTLRRVSAAEQALSRRHAAAALSASSGHFARVLAGMAAAAAQQADLWRAGAGP